MIGMSFGTKLRILREAKGMPRASVDEALSPDEGHLQQLGERL